MPKQGCALICPFHRESKPLVAMLLISMARSLLPPLMLILVLWMVVHLEVENCAPPPHPSLRPPQG